MGLTLLPAIFAAAEYVTGRDFFARARLPGRSIWYVGPVATALLWTLSGPATPLWPLGISWALWRGILGWSTLGGSEDPLTTAQVLGLTLRDIAAFAFLLLPIRFWPDVYWTLVVLAATAFTLCHIALAMFQGDAAREGKDITPQIDVARGLAFGFVYAIITTGVAA